MNQFTPSSDVIDLIDTFKTKQRILILKWIYTVKLRLSKLSTNFNIIKNFNFIFAIYTF
jgi:hypothetical protein